MKLVFGDIVVVDGENIGVVVKCWGRSSKGNPPSYEVYVRMYNGIKTYQEDEVERYMVRHKYLSEEELGYQLVAVNEK